MADGLLECLGRVKIDTEWNVHVTKICSSGWVISWSSRDPSTKRGLIFVVPDMTGLRQGLELLVITRMVVGVQIQDLVLGLGAPLPTNSLVEIEPN